MADHAAAYMADHTAAYMADRAAAYMVDHAAAYMADGTAAYMADDTAAHMPDHIAHLASYVCVGCRQVSVSMAASGWLHSDNYYVGFGRLASFKFKPAIPTSH